MEFSNQAFSLSGDALLSKDGMEDSHQASPLHSFPLSGDVQLKSLSTDSITPLPSEFQIEHSNEEKPLQPFDVNNTTQLIGSNDAVDPSMFNNFVEGIESELMVESTTPSEWEDPGRVSANVLSPYATPAPVPPCSVEHKKPFHISRYIPPPPPKYNTFDVLCGETSTILANEHVIRIANIWVSKMCNSEFYRTHGIWTNDNPSVFISTFEKDPCPSDLGAFFTIREWCLAAATWWDRNFNSLLRHTNNRYMNDSSRSMRGGPSRLKNAPPYPYS
eukprot:Tbor_TRINITY_DN5847_c1_g2::TRINITY_DN5847_c1_g2_i4::g.6167::m.6167